jgi:hypothetical protein
MDDYRSYNSAIIISVNTAIYKLRRKVKLNSPANIPVASGWTSDILY